MPDANKFAKLREVGYTIPGTCRFCTHGWFGGDYFGRCEKHTYEHGKHTGEHRGISIHQCGTCPDWEGDSHGATALGIKYTAFEEFLPGGTPQELPPSKGKKQKG